MTNKTVSTEPTSTVRKPRLVRDVHVLIESLKAIHKDDLMFVLRQVNIQAQVPDSTLFLARRIDDMMNEMKRTQNENADRLQRDIERSLNAATERLENFWTEPGSELNSVETKKPEPEAKPMRSRVLVYGLIGQQMSSIRSSLAKYVDRIDLVTEEGSSKTVRGRYDLVVCSRFVSHQETDRLQAAHSCRVVVQTGGLTSIVARILQETGLVEA